eukprot:2330121-Amphidinium_carterae.1
MHRLTHAHTHTHTRNCKLSSSGWFAGGVCGWCGGCCGSSAGGCCDCCGGGWFGGLGRRPCKHSWTAMQ